MLAIIVDTVVYLCIGIVMMMFGYWVIDLLVPLDFPKEINEGNVAIGWVSAGIYIALGFICRTAISGFELEADADLLSGVLNTVGYGLVGIVAMAVAYFAVDIVNRKFNFAECLRKQNEAAGIMIFGIFIGIAFLVSGVIQ